MVADAVLEGPIPPEGIEELLGDLEELGTTGVLAFQSERGSGAVSLIHGQIVEPRPGAGEERALEVLLGLREGEFAVYPKLPHLPVSRGSDSTRRGSLSVHPPADLMRYCENAGLHGRLLLEHRGRLAIGYYERGQLAEVSIDDGKAEDFVVALEWTEGTFRIDSIPPPRDTLPPQLRMASTPSPAHNPTELPRQPQPSPEGERSPGSEGLPLVQAVEQELVALGGPANRNRDLRIPDPLDEDATIRVVRRPGELEMQDSKYLWSKLDYTPSSATESATTEPVKSKDDGRRLGFRRTLPWVAAAILVIAGCLWLLASLPPLE